MIALVDTNCDPDEADYVVPGNDDAIRACELIIRTIADSIEAGKQKVKVEEFESRDGRRSGASRSPRQPPPSRGSRREPEAAQEPEAAPEPQRATGRGTTRRGELCNSLLHV